MPWAPRQRPIATSSVPFAVWSTWFSSHWKRSEASPIRLMLRMLKQGVSSDGRISLSSLSCASVVDVMGVVKRTSGRTSCCCRWTRSRSCWRSCSCAAIVAGLVNGALWARATLGSVQLSTPTNSSSNQLGKLWLCDWKKRSEINDRSLLNKGVWNWLDTFCEGRVRKGSVVSQNF